MITYIRKKIKTLLQARSNLEVSAGFYWDKKTQQRLNNPVCLESYGYKVYSQNDEDGIIQEILRRIDRQTDRRFVEIGVGNGLENNTHYLLLRGWSGLWIEGSKKSFKQIQEKFVNPINDGSLHIHNEYVTRENINAIFESYALSGEIDVLSIDIDGNDWHVLKAINTISPRIIIIEYNGKFPPDCEWVMEYNPNYIWDKSDRHGASLKSLEILANQKGYQLVGTNYIGVNAFFVRKDLVNELFPVPSTAENLYNPTRFAAVRYKNGHPASTYIGP